MRNAGAPLTAAAVTVLAVAGCGLGAGESAEGEASIRVTRDYGSELIAEGTSSKPAATETVIRFLDREAEVETRYGGGFVQSIEGIEGSVESGRSFDWFFYVNGTESPTGAAEVPVEAGDRIWWDHHDWTDAMRVPAVVGSWPEPFAQATADADALPVRVECATARATCEDAAERLAEEGAEASVGDLGPERRGSHGPLRMIVGEWPRVRREPAAALLDQGPAASGVFASFERRDSSWTLEGLDETATPALELKGAGGLIAAVRDGEEPPTWLVAGTDREGTAAAVAALSKEVLRDRYAVAVSDSDPVALPVVEGGS